MPHDAGLGDHVVQGSVFAVPEWPPAVQQVGDDEESEKAKDDLLARSVGQYRVTWRVSGEDS